MRSTLRLLAKVKAGRYLEPNTPTGLTGLTTHPSPRPALINLYNQTLTKLKELPESSVYRRSTEALTKHRLNIVQNTKPAEYEAWLARIQKVVEQDPSSYEYLKQPDGSYTPRFVLGETKIEWDGEKKQRFSEGVKTQAEVAEIARKMKSASTEHTRVVRKELEVEPALDADQIVQIENQIGAGLIEEVIEVAEGELNVIDAVTESKAWEPLEEKAPEGQWTYFERGAHTGTPGGASGPKT